MRIEIASELPKLGQRPYVQGGTIFNGILDLCDTTLGSGWLANTVVASFKLEREAVANGRLVVADCPQEELDPNATFVARRAEGPLFGYFIDDGAETQRIPYDEGSYYRVLDVESSLRGRFAFAGGRPRADFMRGIVGANKLLHQKTDRFGCKLTHIQFLYLKGLDGVCLTRVAEDYEVSIANATVQDRGDEVWTINRVEIRGSSFTTDFRICYRARRTTAGA